ncbi:MAG: pyridoxamine kinase [Lachnospiraceae bacterium]|nr:pyridoxamine kinase [Lachnospiraceae bacterium]
MQKKIAVINDLSGYGRCSLTVAMPILSVMRYQCCPVPTAILSNHTGFHTFFYDDYTEKLTAYIGAWERLGLSFDAVLTGFFGSAEQIRLVTEIVNGMKKKGSAVIVDPVMGDDGELYQTYTEEMCGRMRELAALSDVVVPNVTECCLLTGMPYREAGFKRQELFAMALRLRDLGAKSVVITGAREGSFLTNVVLEAGKAEAEFVRMRSLGVSRPGTGDVFSSVLAGAVLGGRPLAESVYLAARFVRDCIKKSDELGIPVLNGVCFEELLGKLGRGFVRS